MQKRKTQQLKSAAWRTAAVFMIAAMTAFFGEAVFALEFGIIDQKMKADPNVQVVTLQAIHKSPGRQQLLIVPIKENARLSTSEDSMEKEPALVSAPVGPVEVRIVPVIDLSEQPSDGLAPVVPLLNPENSGSPGSRESITPSAAVTDSATDRSSEAEDRSSEASAEQAESLPADLSERFQLPTPPAVSAESAVLIDADTGVILYEKNGSETRGIASTTKIMTALCVLEQAKAHARAQAEAEIQVAEAQIQARIAELTAANLATVVRVPDESVYYPGSCFMLKPGERVSILDLLYGLLLQSGNDAGDALARVTSGSVEEFCELMNAKAASLGAVQTHFTSPHGYPKDSAHYSTAKDMALIVREALQNETLREIAEARSYESGRKDPEYRVVENKNRVIFDYEGGILGKTGYTTEAGRCLVSAAKRDGTTLICVVLAADQVYEDSYRLFDYGFEADRVFDVIEKSEYQLNLIGIDSAVENGGTIGKSVGTESAVGASAGASAGIVTGRAVGLPLIKMDDTNYVSLNELQNRLSGSALAFSFAREEGNDRWQVGRPGEIAQDAGTSVSPPAFSLKHIAGAESTFAVHQQSECRLGTIQIGNQLYVRVRDLGPLLNLMIGWNPEAGEFNLVVKQLRDR